MTNSITTFTTEEWDDISEGLSGFHNIFYRFWTVCRPSFTDRVKTAAVAFDKTGNCIDFLINYNFWKSLSRIQKLFVISHECLHLILNHGKRGIKAMLKGKDIAELVNIAMDVAVNQALIERYGFDRNEIDPTNKYVWADKVAESLKLPSLATDRCFEYYFNLLNGKMATMYTPGTPLGPLFGETVDDHDNSFAGQGDDESLGSDVLKRLSEELDGGELEDLQNTLNAERNAVRIEDERENRKPGDDPLGHTFKLNITPPVPKKKWETIIRKWVSKTLKETEVEEEQWARTSRRFTMLDKRLSLPYEMETDTFSSKRDKIDVWFFLDTSGSCIALAPRFFKAAMSLPKQKFNVNLFCFDTKVYETNLISRKVKGGGGTRFDILEKYINEHTTGKKYPSAVFVITDGYGNDVKPKNPKVWHWFLSVDMRQHVPQESLVYMLKDFE